MDRYNSLTGVFPTEPKEKSKDLLNKTALEVVGIKSEKKISKQGKYLTIEDKKIDISKKTLQEVVYILIENNIQAKLIINKENEAFVPAIMINDFESYRTKSIKPNTNPVDLSFLSYEPYFSIKVNKQPLAEGYKAFNGYSPASFKIKDDRLFLSNNEPVTLYYKLRYYDYSLTLSSNTISSVDSSQLYIYNYFGELKE